jgi:hypothetical protein
VYITFGPLDKVMEGSATENSPATELWHYELAASGPDIELCDYYLMACLSSEINWSVAQPQVGPRREH